MANTTSATSIWKGASGTHGAADWLAEDTWDGGVPTGDATAVFNRVNDERPHVVLTPPGSFTSASILSNGMETATNMLALGGVHKVSRFEQPPDSRFAQAGIGQLWRGDFGFGMLRPVGGLIWAGAMQ